MEGKLFRRLGIWTIVAVYILILVGGVVRATGSGMGCPDWPKCFGTWIPPTDVSQLPVNYKEIFGAKLKGEVEFNVVKTWTEYINRLVGASIGLLIFATFVVAFKEYWKKDKVIVWLSFLSFILVGFEGWLGAKVVSNELLPSMVTIHMLVSIIIVFLIQYTVVRSYSDIIDAGEFSHKSSINYILTILIVLTVGQILFGTQVRELVDEASFTLGESARSEWIASIGGKYYFHAGFSVLLLIINFILFRKIEQNTVQKGLVNVLSKSVTIVLAIEIIAGGVLGFLSLPAFIQPIHLTLSVIIVGLQFVLMLIINKKNLS